MKLKWIKYNNTIFMAHWNITLFPFIFLVGKNEEDVVNRIGVQGFEKLINHESIHWYQQLECLIIPFYLIYFVNWAINLFTNKGNAYRSISFEREAYSNADNDNYLTERKLFAWIKYIKKK